MFTMIGSLVEILGSMVAGILLVVLAYRMRFVPFGMQVIDKVDDNTAFDELTEAQLGLEQAKRPDGADEAPQPPKGEEDKPGGGEETADDKAAREKKEADDKAAAAAAGAGAGAGGEEKLFAGKYKTQEELTKGVVEIGKALKLEYDADYLSAVATALKKAKESGNYEVVEKLYEELNKGVGAGKVDFEAIGKLLETEKAPEKPGAAVDPTKETQQRRTQDGGVSNEQAVALYALQETEAVVFGSRVARELAAAGFELPENFLRDPKVTAAFMDKLREEKLSVEWMQLNQMISRTWNAKKQEAAAYLQSEAESKTHNETMRSAEVKRIKDYAGKIGLKVTDAEVEAFLKDAENDPWAVELKNDVAFLRENGLFNVWKMKNFDTITKQLDVTAETRGRTQMAKDLKELQEKAANGSRPSTAGMGAGRQEQPKVNLDNPDEIERMGEEELFGAKAPSVKK